MASLAWRRGNSNSSLGRSEVSSGALNKPLLESNSPENFFRITSQSNISANSTSSSDEKAPNYLLGRRQELKSELVRAEMKAVEHMCSEISLRYKRKKYLMMLEEEQKMLEEPLCAYHPGDQDTPGRTRAKSSATAERKRAESLEVLNHEIPAILKNMRANIEETEEVSVSDI